MMSSEKEQQFSADLRMMARQYCDGAFNKGEYRRRRRALLDQCVESDYSMVDDSDDDMEEPIKDPVVSTNRSNGIAVAMITVSVLVLGVIVYLLNSVL